MGVRVKNLVAAVEEAQRFILLTKAVRCEVSITNGYEYRRDKRTAAMKRASMDLTRALADLRRSGDV